MTRLEIYCEETAESARATDETDVTNDTKATSVTTEQMHPINQPDTDSGAAN